MIERGDSPYAWASGILRREIEGGTFGAITFTLQNGLIVGAKVEKSEKPPQRPVGLAPKTKSG